MKTGDLLQFVPALVDVVDLLHILGWSSCRESGPTVRSQNV